MRAGVAALALGALLACAQQAPSSSPPAPPQLITPDGLGPVLVGMTTAEAEAALGRRLTPETPLDNPEVCQIWHPGEINGGPVYYLAEAGRIARISVGEGAEEIRTPQGVGVGSTSAEVRRAYPGAIEQPPPYDEPPAHDLIVWTVPDRRGFRFEINQQGRVWALHAGGRAILLIEGCA